MPAEDWLAIAGEAIAEAFWNCAWAQEESKLFRKCRARAHEKICRQRIVDYFLERVPNRIASEWRRQRANAPSAARTIDQASGQAGTPKAQGPQRHNREAFLLQNKSMAPLVPANASSRRAPIHAAEHLPGPDAPKVARAAMRPTPRKCACPSDRKFRELRGMAKARR